MPKSKNSRFVTEDHKPEKKKEQELLKVYNGYIKDGRANGILAMTRALGNGDLFYRMSHTPDVYVLQTDKIQSNILLASDGVFETLQSSDVFKLMGMGYNAKKIGQYAYKTGSTDNITCIIFKPFSN